MPAIKLLRHNFDRDKAIEFAKLIKHAYDLYWIYYQGESWSNYQIEGYDNLQFFAADPFFDDQYKKLYGFLTAKGDDVYIVFRGTASYTDWWIDASFKLTPFTSFQGRIHRGFNRMFGSCWHDINIPLLKYLELGKKNVYLMGHSLGGALATLCAIDVERHFSVQPIVYTFASPMVGDSEFAEKYQSSNITNYRIFNTEDIVPKGPGKLCSKYKHIGVSIKFVHDYGSLEDNHSLVHHIEQLKEIILPV